MPGVKACSSGRSSRMLATTFGVEGVDHYRPGVAVEGHHADAHPPQVEPVEDRADDLAGPLRPLLRARRPRVGQLHARRNVQRDDQVADRGRFRRGRVAGVPRRRSAAKSTSRPQPKRPTANTRTGAAADSHARGRAAGPKARCFRRADRRACSHSPSQQAASSAAVIHPVTMACTSARTAILDTMPAPPARPGQRARKNPPAATRPA